MSEHLHVVCPHCHTTNRVLRTRLGSGPNCGSCRRALEPLHFGTLGQEAGVKIVGRALEEPLRQIVANAGQDPSVVVGRVAAGAAGYGYNAATGEYGDMIAMGIIDPTKVTRLGLQNAASIASLILTTDCIIVETPKNEGSAPEELHAGYS